MIVNGNALNLPIASGSVQCVVTSPPYFGLRDYGIDGQLGLEQTPDAYVANMVLVFREVWRVLKDDGVVWLNLGDSYGGGNGGNATNSEKQKSNYGTQIEPRHGNMPKQLLGIPWRVAFALQADGWYLRSDIIWSKPNPMPESVTDRPTKAHEYIFMLTKAARYYWDQEAVKEPANYDGRHDEKMHGSGKYNSAIVPGEQVQSLAMNGHTRWKKNEDGLRVRNLRTVWTIATQPTSYAHFATFPEKLAETCIKAGSRPDDVVLDPFAGSGTVERVAVRLGRRSIGTELNYKYIREIVTRRTSNIQVCLPMEAA